MAKIDTKVTPSLHPDNVKGVDGYDEATAPYLNPVVEAFSTAYEGIKAIHDARAKAERNPGWTEAQRVLQLAKCGEQYQESITRKFDAVHKTLTTQIAALEQELSTPLKEGAGRTGSIPSEIRELVRNMTAEQRHEFFKQAHDDMIWHSILGAPAMLSGMSEDERTVRTRLYHETKSPESAQRLKALTAAREMIRTRGPLVFGEVTKAVGASWAQVKRLREVHSAAEQALILRDHSQSAA